ncbi:MAG: NADH-quinone oxidoreductase subunit L [Pirellulaceae bacterium]
MNVAYWLPVLLGTAVLIPLISFFAILIAGPKMGKAGVCAGYVATGAIGLAAILSLGALGVWLAEHAPVESHGKEHAAVTPADAERVAGVDAAHAHGPSHAEDGDRSVGHASKQDGGGEEKRHAYTGEFQVLGLGGPWVLGQFGDLRLSVSYYIDALTVCMFCMVTLIATLIHIYAMGYMHEELQDVTDPEVHLDHGEDLKRPGRYHRFFQSLSLFSFSMLGLVLAGNLALVFVFWELVGICSYFLIGFYIERKSASTAANKAFIVNRIGDFGMIIGLMALWSSLGTLSFGEITYQDRDGKHQVQPGIFTLVRSGDVVDAPDGMVILACEDKVAEVVQNLGPDATRRDMREAMQEAVQAEVPAWRASTGGPPGAGPGYGLLIVAGVGIFAGCVGKSAQFPLHVWLPDAMEGPTPVSALVHSATMVAAGVYLVGRFYPAFPPEVLLVIAITGCITLFMAATIAITATDIKRVLAYSTVSQLGYMMMALGVGAWTAGMMHLIAHAFFKSLLFLCSGSVIHAVHTNEMPQMGGLLKKMPVTAWTMLVGCLAISGAGIPFIVGLALGGHGLDGLGLSGCHSKDAILEQAYSFMGANGSAWAGFFFAAGAGGAAITAFYMFRMWYLTFAGEPRDQHRFEHAHESPPTMYVPLIVLAVMAIAVAWQPLQGIWGALLAAVLFFVWRWTHPPTDPLEDTPRRRFALADLPLGLSVLVLAVALLWNFTPLHATHLKSLLGQAEPFNSIAGSKAPLLGWVWPSEHVIHTEENLGTIVVPVTLVAMGSALVGFLLATFMYGLGRLNPDEVRRQFKPLYRFLLNKWWFDELYDGLFVKPVHWLAARIASVDRNWIDRFVDGLARTTRWLAVTWEWVADQIVVDGLVDGVAARTYALGRSLRNVQTGRIRQYVMFIVIGAVALFVLINLWKSTLAG